MKDHNMNEEVPESKPCPYCRYLITPDRITCAHCGTISPMLWEKRITDDWEIDKSLDGKGIDRLAESIAYKTHSSEHQSINKYESLHSAAERVDKLFLSKITIETHLKDIDMLFDRFLQSQLGREYSRELTVIVKEGYRLFLFKVRNLYRFIGYDGDTITLFEISESLHDKIKGEIGKREEERRASKRKREEKWKELERAREDEEEAQYKKDLEEYNALPWLKRKFKGPPKEPNLLRRK